MIGVVHGSCFIAPLFYIICFFCGVLNSCCWADFQAFDHVKKGVVSIAAHIGRAAYSTVGLRLGTGFLADKKQGIIVTTATTCSATGVGSYFVTFDQGEQLSAQKIYVDTQHGLAFLKVDPAQIPDHVPALTLAAALLKPADEVFIVGKNDAGDFSFQSGHISSHYEMHGALSNQCMRISLNITGKVDGAPVFDSNGHVVSLVLSIKDTAVYATQNSCLKRLLQDVVQQRIPQRGNLGVHWNYEAVDTLKRYSRFPDHVATSYNAMYPEAQGKILVVSCVYTGSPARKKLKPGDALLKVNNTEIGPYFDRFQEIIDSQQPLHVQIVRNGKIKQYMLHPDDMNQTQVRRFFDIGGATFYESDSYINAQGGCKKSAVMITNADAGSPFHSAFAKTLGALSNGQMPLLIQLKKIDHTIVKKLDDVIKMTPGLIKKQHFTVEFIVYLSSLDTRPHLAHVTLSAHQEPARLFAQSGHSWSITMFP